MTGFGRTDIPVISETWYKRLLSFWFIREFIIINKLAWPSVIFFFGTQMIPLTSLMFTGHIGKGVYLDGAALALSFGNVTGTSIVIGLSSGMDTLCSQAYGGKNYHLVGVYFQRATLLCLLVCFPIWALWLNAEFLLILLHQDPEVAAVAGRYLRILCVAKPAVVLFNLSTKFLQTQNIVNPTIWLTILGNVVNVCCQYLFVVHLGFGVEGSALSVSIAYWSLAIMYVLYIRCSSLYLTSWPGWTCDIFRGWLHYCKYGIPGLFMICLEWWTYEIGYFVVGGTSINSKIEVGIYSVLFNLTAQIFMVTLGFQVAATVRVGNLLGANMPTAARNVAFLCLGIILLIGIVFAISIFLLRFRLPNLFTNDSCIVAGASKGFLIVAMYIIFDLFQSVAGGVLKACGRQAIGSITNLVAFQFIAIPLAVCLSVVLKLGTRGFWLGLSAGSFIQASTYFLLVLCTNWRRVADVAAENVGLSKPISLQQSNSLQDTEYTSLLESSTSGKTLSRKRFTILCAFITKLLVILFCIASFALGLGFSLRQSHNHSHLLYNTSLNSSSINATLVICPY